MKRTSRIILIVLAVGLAPAAPATAQGIMDSLAAFGQRLGLARPASPAFLEPDRAFVFTAEALDAGTVGARWQIAPGYYLYRDKFSFRLQGADEALGAVQLPAGEWKEDAAFGRTQVYYRQVEIRLPVERAGPGARHLVLEAVYQGCAERGFCYAPIDRSMELVLPAPGG